MSADDLRINLWHLEVTSQCFNIVDKKPADMEDLVGDLVIFFYHQVVTLVKFVNVNNWSLASTDACVRLCWMMNQR